MKYLKFLHISIILTLFIMCGTAQAKGDKFILTNNSGKIITEVHCSVDSTNRWGKNLVGDSGLKDGKSVNIYLQPFERYWDFKVVFKDGTRWSFNQVDVFMHGTLIIHNDGRMESSRDYHKRILD